MVYLIIISRDKSNKSNFDRIVLLLFGEKCWMVDRNLKVACKIFTGAPAGTSDNI